MAKTNKGKYAIKFSAFEDDINLSEFIDFDLEHHAGAMVLQNSIDSSRIFRFGFETTGIHSCLDEKRFLLAFQKLEAGLQKLPFAENITIKVSSFSESKTRIAQLEKLLPSVDNPGVRLLLESEQEKVADLKTRGIRQPKRLRIYATYTPDRPFERHGASWQDKFFKSLVGQAKSVMSKLDSAAVRKKNNEFFAQVYQSGFMYWRRFIQERMGLRCIPLTAEQLWAELYDEFSDLPAPPIPQVIRVTSNHRDTSGAGVKYAIDVNSKVSAATHLTKQTVPVDDDRWVKVKDRYIGCLTFIDKPLGWPDEQKQLSYLWDVLSHDESGDMEVVCQLSVGSQKSERKNLQRHSTQSTAKKKSSKGGSDRMANRRQQEAEEAEDKVLEGNTPLNVGCCLLVYRDNVRQLDEACANISSQFHSAWVAREEKIAWKLWSQCLPTSADSLLSKAMFDRRQVYSSDEAMAFAPLFNTGSNDLDGVEFLAADGSSVFIDLFDFGNPLNMALFASTRSGKSVLVAAFLLHALARDIPIIAMDYPKADGSSTFSDFTKLMGSDGAYYNIAEECNNIFHQPDLSSVDIKKRGLHMAQFESSLKHIVLSLIGQSGSKNLDSDVKSELMPLVSDFLAQESIQARYDAANKAGQGTPEWENCPTLYDFKDFVPEVDSSGSTQKALDYIHRRLKYWLKSEISNAIAKPSTFRDDARLIVFALTNLSDDEDAAILGLAAYSAAIRRSLSYDASIFFIDESPILFQFPMISQLIASLTANFGKAGGRVILTAQTVTAIAQSGHAAQILGNCKVKMVGCVEAGQEKSFIEHIKMDERQANLCSAEEFIRKKGEDWSNWMLNYGGKVYQARFFPGKKLLNSVANNPPEQKTREYFMEHLPVDVALDATAAHLKECLKKNINPLTNLPSLEIVLEVKAALEEAEKESEELPEKELTSV